MRGAKVMALTAAGFLSAGFQAMAADHAPTRESAQSGLAMLARARDAAGGAAWDRTGNLEGRGRIRVSGLTGTWSRIESVADGRFVTKIDVGVFRSADVNDGRRRWRQGPSGGVHPLDGTFAQQATTTEAWLAKRGWLRRDGAGASIGPAVPREEAGRSFVAVEAIPPGGQPVELWFDAKTRLLDRTIRAMPISIRTVRYGDYRNVGGVRVPFSIETRETDTSDVETISVDRWTIVDAVDANVYARPIPPDDVSLDGETTVPLDIEGLVVVEAKLNGRAFQFILDTGGHNILTPEAAKALGVTPVGAGASGGAGAGELPQQYTRIDRVDIGNATLRDQHFYVIPFQYATVERGPREPLAGLLGLEIFERFAVRIDYPGKMLTLRKASDYRHGGRGTAVPITFDDDMPLLEGAIDGRRGLIALDTGNSGSTVIQHVWARKNGIADKSKRGVETVSYGAGGESRNWASRLDRIEIGGTVLHDMIGRYAEDAAGAFSSRTEAANIGTDVLANFVLDFDYANSVIWFDYRPGHVPRPFPRAGMRTIKEGPQAFRVTLVNLASPAAAAGIARGDEIVAVDGVPATALSGREFADKLIQPVGTEVALTLRRDGREWTTRVRLKELLP